MKKSKIQDLSTSVEMEMKNDLYVSHLDLVKRSPRHYLCYNAPMQADFSKIIGHSAQKDYLNRILAAGKITHAYGFFGPAKTGKHLMAKAFASAAASSKPEQNPNWQSITAEEGKISVETIRNARQRMHLSSLGGGSKVLIIEDAHLMTTAAQNALLKTLEEPRGNALIILISAHPNRLLPTIRSRMAHIYFNLVSNQDLEALSTDQDLIISAIGRPGKLIELMDPDALTEHQEITTLASDFLNGDLVTRFKIAGSIAKDKQKNRIPGIITLWRHALKKDLDQALLDPSKSALKSARALLRLTDVERSLQRNTNKQLALEWFARGL